MQELTTEQAHALTRASWPRPYTETIPHDYSMHTAECSECDDTDEPGIGIAMTLLILAGLCVSAAAMVAGVVALVQKVAA